MSASRRARYTPGLNGRLTRPRSSQPEDRVAEEAPVTDVVIPLVIRALAPEDLPSCAWWVSPWDRAQLGKTLDRAQRGEVDCLSVCPPSGLPVALGGVDYTLTPGAGTLWRLAEDGSIRRYETMCALMRKELS